MRIRDAIHSDLPQILAIFNDVIATSTTVYALGPVSLEDRAQWMQARQAQGFPILAAVDGDDLLGFASYGEWRMANGVARGADTNSRSSIRCMSRPGCAEPASAAN